MASFLRLLSLALLAVAAANEAAPAATEAVGAVQNAVTEAAAAAPEAAPAATEAVGAVQNAVTEAAAAAPEAGAVKDAVTEAVTDAAAAAEPSEAAQQLVEPETPAGEETPATEQEAEETAAEEASEGAAADTDPPVQTTLSAATVAGAEALEVVSAAGFAVGGLITITTPAGVEPVVTEEAEIRGFGSLVLAKALANVFPAGSTVSQAQLTRTYPPNGGGGCPSIKDRTACCKHKDDRESNPTGVKDMDCVPAAPEKVFATGNVCEPACVIADKCGESYPTEAADLIGTCEFAEPPAPTPAPEVATTTTYTPWDSSASSSDSDSLESSYSSSFKEDSSDSSAESSLESSGSTASGSSGSYLPLWMWLALFCLLCVCCAGAAAAMAPKKKAPKKKPAPAPKGPAATTLSAAAPGGASRLEVASQAGFKAGQIVEIDAGSPLAEIHEVAGLGSIILTAPLLYPHAVGAPVNELPDGRPLPALIETTAAVIPSYQMAAPMTTSYAAPIQTTAYAAPAMTGYAPPMSYAAPAAYSTGAVYTGGYGGYGGAVV